MHDPVLAACTHLMPVGAARLTGCQAASHMPPALKWLPLPLHSVLTVLCASAASRYAFYYYFAQVRLLGAQL